MLGDVELMPLYLGRGFSTAIEITRTTDLQVFHNRV